MMLDGTLQGNSVVHCMYIEIVYLLLGKGLGPCALDPLKCSHVFNFYTYDSILTNPILLCTGPKTLPFIIHISKLGSRVHVKDA
jgi:hypothetical protein